MCPGKTECPARHGCRSTRLPANVPPEHPDSYYSTGARLAKEHPGSIYINQYFNPKNAESYYLTAGPEIWKQTNGKVTHFFACSGTGGTISGIGKYLKEQNPAVEVIGVDAVGSILKKYKETGIIDPNELQPYRMEGVGKNMIPTATDFSVIDRFVKVNDFESAHVARMGSPWSKGSCADIPAVRLWQPSSRNWNTCLRMPYR